MRAKCAMYGCKSATYNRIGYILTFHRFPRDLKRQNIWKELCRNPRINKKKPTNLWLCSLHFEKSCYSNESLKPNAIPTLKLAETSVGLFSYHDQANKTGIDANNSTSIKGAVQKDSGASTSQAKETIQIQHDDAVKELVTNQEPHQEEDDCESVNFSSSEDEGSKDEIKQDPEDWDQDVSPASCLVLSDSNPEASNSPSRTTDLVHHKLSVTSKPAVSHKKTLPVKSVIDRTIEECLEDPEDDCSTFATHVKTRMRRFHPQQKVIAQKLISDVMFMADTMQLQLGSAVENPRPKTEVHDVTRSPEGGIFSSCLLDTLDSDDDEGPMPKKKK